MPRLEHEILLPTLGVKSTFQITDWCTQQFGQRWCALDNRQGRWCCFWGGRNHPKFYRWCFQDEQDAMMFTLRWA